MSRYDELLRQIDLSLESKKSEGSPGDLFTILEIGTWSGRSAMRMIERAQRHGSRVMYFGFDLFEDLTSKVKNLEFCGKKPPPSRDVVKRELEKTGAKILLHKGDTRTTLASLVEGENLWPVDFAFIDGGHSLETIANDWRYVSRLMHERTRVVFDDWFEERDDVGCVRTVREIEESGKYDVGVIDPGDRDRKSGLTVHLAVVTRR